MGSKLVGLVVQHVKVQIHKIFHVVLHGALQKLGITPCDHCVMLHVMSLATSEKVKTSSTLTTLSTTYLSKHKQGHTGGHMV